MLSAEMSLNLKEVSSHLDKKLPRAVLFASPKNQDHWGMIPENSRRVIKMKQTLYDGSRKTTVNTRYDECLYHGSRQVSDQPDEKVTGKDLYMHIAGYQDKRITSLSPSLV